MSSVGVEDGVGVGSDGAATNNNSFNTCYKYDRNITDFFMFLINTFVVFAKVFRRSAQSME